MPGRFAVRPPSIAAHVRTSALSKRSMHAGMSLGGVVHPFMLFLLCLFLFLPLVLLILLPRFVRLLLLRCLYRFFMHIFRIRKLHGIRRRRVEGLCRHGLFYETAKKVKRRRDCCNWQSAAVGIFMLPPQLPLLKLVRILPSFPVFHAKVWEVGEWIVRKTILDKC